MYVFLNDQYSEKCAAFILREITIIESVSFEIAIVMFDLKWKDLFDY